MLSIRKTHGDERIGKAIQIGQDALFEGKLVPVDAHAIIASVVNRGAYDDVPRTLGELVAFAEANQIVPVHDSDGK
jgi:hypothetical protein